MKLLYVQWKWPGFTLTLTSSASAENKHDENKTHEWKKKEVELSENDSVMYRLMDLDVEIPRVFAVFFFVNAQTNTFKVNLDWQPLYTFFNPVSNL